jgi:hypothetical protein
MREQSDSELFVNKGLGLLIVADMIAHWYSEIVRNVCRPAFEVPLKKEEILIEDHL